MSLLWIIPGEKIQHPSSTHHSGITCMRSPEDISNELKWRTFLTSLDRPLWVRVLFLEGTDLAYYSVAPAADLAYRGVALHGVHSLAYTLDHFGVE